MIKELMIIVRRRRRWPYGLAVLVLLGAYVAWALLRPLPMLAGVPVSVPRQAAPTITSLAWPAAGQAAVGIMDSSILETHGTKTPLPTASTAKLITALTVLQKKPLKPGQQGPIVTLSANDVALYKSYVAHGGSVVPVADGEQISEYQMLQAIMLPSANNMADSLAIWAFGSLPAYTTAANTYLERHGLTDTDVGSDASGYAPNTTSSAHDLVKLGELAMNNPVLSQIVAQPTAVGLPVVNNVKNVNWLLGTAGIIGVKTGNTDQAGGVFVSASRITVNHQPLTIVTALNGASTLAAAMKDSLTLVKSAQANFSAVTVVKANTVYGNYRVPWGGKLSAIASKDLTLQTWKGSAWTSANQLKPIKASASAGTIVGAVNVTANNLPARYKVPLKLQSSPTPPSLGWRLLHPF